MRCWHRGLQRLRRMRGVKRFLGIRSKLGLWWAVVGCAVLAGRRWWAAIDQLWCGVGLELK